tara:strand:- start:294 stop:602 length:309 start_codon:yes stop_codon:yes gene_type:complete
MASNKQLQTMTFDLETEITATANLEAAACWVDSVWLSGTTGDEIVQFVDATSGTTPVKLTLKTTAEQLFASHTFAKPARFGTGLRAVISGTGPRVGANLKTE